MPVTQLRDGRQRWYTEDFSGGVNMFLHPTVVPDNQFPVLENVIVKSEGSYITADKRRGFERYNTNAVDSGRPLMSMGEYISQNKAANFTRLIVKSEGTTASNSTLKYTDISSGEYTGTWTAIATNELAGKYKYLTFKDNLYICNRKGAVEVNKFWDGTNYLDMGLIPAKPATMAANDTGVGNIEDDTFYYFVTFTYDNGQESGMLTLAAGYGAVATTTGAGSKITVTNVPTGNARVTARNLYRCSGTNPSQIFYVGTINDNVSTTYVDNVASAKLGLPVPASTIYNYPKPYKSRIQFVHEERLIQMNLQEDLYLPIPTADVTLTSSNSGTGTLTPGQVWSFKIYKLWFTTFNPITNEEVQYIISQPLTKSVTILGGHDSITFAHSSSDLWYGSIHLQAADVNTTVNYHPFDDTVTGYNSSIRAAGTTFGIQQITPKGGIGVTPEGEGTKYTSWVAFSEESEPDKITRGNLMKIGQDDNEEITAGFSRYGGWDVFKGSSIHRVFTPSRDPITWEQKKIVEDIGSTYPESIVQLPDDSYIFAMNKRTAGADRVTFYYWDGHSSPKIISGSIQSYLNGITVSDIDAVHDKANNFVRIAYTIEGSYKGQELVYDPNKVGPNGNVYQDWANGIWNPNPRNTADLELRCPFVTKAGKLLYGHEQGYVYHQSTTSNQDKLGAGHSNTQILVKCQPKTQEDLQGELKIKKLLFNVVASGAGSANGFVIYTSADDSESPLANPPTVASGENRFEVGVNIRAKKFYLRVEHAENINIKLRMVGWDFDVRHRGSGARR